MAKNKSKFSHPATWVHAMIHAVALGLALGWPGGIVLGIVHILIDTRAPLTWWRNFFRQTTDGPYAVLTAVWADQVLHLLTIVLWVSIASAWQVPPLTAFLPTGLVFWNYWP